MIRGYAGHAARSGNVGKAPALPIPEQAVTLVSQRVDKHIGPAIVIVIREIDAHSRERLSVFVVSHPEIRRNLCETAVSAVAEELFRKGVVRHYDVRPAIAVEVVDG